MGFFRTFRGRLLLILSILLIFTLSVQYYLNLLSQEENNELRDAQTQALVAGLAIGVAALTSSEDRVQDFVERPGQTFLDDNAKQRIKDIIIIDSDWQVTDSLNPAYMPETGPNDEAIYRKLSSLDDLPPIMEGNRLGNDLRQFPNRGSVNDKDTDDEAHAVPIETSRGRWYVMVLLKNDRSEAAWRAARPLIITLALLLISTLVTFYLVWRFTRPISALSDAARRVAEGDLDVRVPYGGQDEIGSLAERFNEMTAELEKSKELEQQLQQAEKSAVIGRLGSAIAHEIRNPLNYINLTLDHLRSKFAPVEEDRREIFIKLTSQLKSEVARIDQQITDFLNYSRPPKINVSPIDIRSVVDDSLRIVEAQAAENGIKVSLVEHENVPQILADAEALRSVFNNLFINAVQAMGAGGGKLSVSISPGAGGGVAITVEDTGGGIPPENLSKVFEPYFSTKETGTGLGLAIVHKVIELHQGSIDVESQQGGGTRFVVQLP